MRALFFDTETTGLPNFKLPYTDPSQPHIVQLAFQLYDLTADVVLATHSMLIIPKLYSSIEPGAFNAHGISVDRANTYGLDPAFALLMFQGFADKADLIVAHNFDFDRGMMKRTYHALNKPDILEGKKSFCTMKSTTQICGLTAANGRPKWPTLTQLHLHCHGVPFSGAHDALIDVIACRDCFLHLYKKGAINVN